MSEENELKPEHQAFADEYIVDFNGTQAYLRVYPDCTNESAWASASRLLGNVKVQEAIAKAIEERSKRCHIDQDEVLRFWSKQMNAPEKHVELSSRSIDTCHGEELGGGSNVYKAPDRMKASENVAKHLGMFKEDVNVKHSGIVTHDHEGLPATLEFLRGFKRERVEGASTKPLPN